MAAQPHTMTVAPPPVAAPRRPSPPGSALLALDHEELVIRRGTRSGLYTVVAVHSTALGPSLGGCRMWRYPSGAEAARDALRLSRAMTLKAAAAGLDLGGGKGVICLAPGAAGPEGASRREAVLDDVDERKRRLAAELPNATWVAPDDALAADVDVLSPCALGGVLDEDTVPRLRARVVCGSANNQLADDGLAAELAALGVLYAPDFVVNAGGLINVATGLDPDGYDAERAAARVAEIEPVMVAVL